MVGFSLKSSVTERHEMNRLFFKYYIDITRINIPTSIVIGYFTNVFICFGTFGVLISFMTYRYFQNDQYYFYLNHGYTKNELMFKVFIINFLIASLLFLIII